MEEKQISVEEKTEPSRNFDLTSFSRAKDKMIATNEMAYQGRWNNLRNFVTRTRDYSIEEIEAIISSGSLQEQQRLSRNYFNRDGYYRQIIIHYATLLKYAGLLIPNPTIGKKLSTSHIQKRYYLAQEYIERMNLPVTLVNFGQRALVDGSYYGIKVETDKNTFSVIDLPSGYACSRFKDIYGNDVLEFDLSYFNTITDKTEREDALAAYPKIVSKAYKELDRGKRKTKWLRIPKELGLCFPFFDGRPLFLNVIPATILYDEAVATERMRDAEEIKKIIVQQIPHLTDGRLLFEPDEAYEIHQGTVGMMKDNDNVRVLTSYGNISAIASHTSADKTDNSLTRMEQNIYAQAGVSGQIFASTGSSSLQTSLTNDLALMMYLANKFSNFITNHINDIFANGNINFKYMILPVSHHNMADFVDMNFKLLGSGYSALIPAVAIGMSQRDLVNIKDLENEVLKLGDKLIPLSTSYTQSGSDPKKSEEGKDGEDSKDGKEKTQNPEEDGGRPKLKEEEKSEKTIENEKSLDKTGGGS